MSTTQYKDYVCSIETYDQHVVNVYPYEDYKMWAQISRSDQIGKNMSNTGGINYFPIPYPAFKTFYPYSTCVIQRMSASFKKWSDKDTPSDENVTIKPVEWVQIRQFIKGRDTSAFPIPEIGNDPILIKMVQNTGSYNKLYIRVSLRYSYSSNEDDKKAYISQWKLSLVKPDAQESVTDTYVSNGSFANDDPYVEHYEYLFDTTSVYQNIFFTLGSIIDNGDQASTLESVTFGFLADGSKTLDGTNDAFGVIVKGEVPGYDSGGYVDASSRTDFIDSFLKCRSYQTILDSFAGDTSDYATKEYVQSFVNRRFPAR